MGFQGRKAHVDKSEEVISAKLTVAFIYSPIARLRSILAPWTTSICSRIVTSCPIDMQMYSLPNPPNTLTPYPPSKHPTFPAHPTPQWQSAYDALATYVHANEPTTKTYYFGIPLDYAHDFSVTTSMFAFEVYGKREDLYTTHLGSPAMAKFLELIPASTTTNLDLAHYRCVAGFLDLHGAKEEAGVLQDVKITCTGAEARERLLGALSRLVGGVMGEERGNGGKGGVYTYMAFACLDDDVGVRIMGRWKGRSDMEAFVRRADVGAFWAEGKEKIARMEQRLYLPNGKGWLHRGSGFAGDEKGGTKL